MLTPVLASDLPSFPSPVTNLDLGSVLGSCLWPFSFGGPSFPQHLCIDVSVPLPSFIDFGLAHLPASTGVEFSAPATAGNPIPSLKFLLIRNPN